MDSRDYDGMKVLDALADTAIDATLVALNSAKSGKFTEANEMLNFVERLTYQIISIEDHNKSDNRSGSDINHKAALANVAAIRAQPDESFA